MTLFQDPQATESPGAADRFFNKGAFFPWNWWGISGQQTQFSRDVMGTPSYTLTLNCTSSDSCAAGSFLPANQAAQGDKAVPTKGCNSKPIHGVPQDHTLQRQGQPPHGSGCSSNTSTPKHPDSTSAKNSSSSREPTSNGQEKSPKAHSSHKPGHSPFPICRVSQTQMERCQHGRHPHTQLNPPHQLQCL